MQGVEEHEAMIRRRDELWHRNYHLRVCMWVTEGRRGLRHSMRADDLGGGPWWELIKPLVMLMTF